MVPRKLIGEAVFRKICKPISVKTKHKSNFSDDLIIQVEEDLDTYMEESIYDDIMWQTRTDVNPKFKE